MFIASEAGRSQLGRRIDVEMLVSSYEVQRLLASSNDSHLAYWIREMEFPEPIASLGRSQQVHLWYWPDVAKWGFKQGRVGDGAWLVAPWRILERLEQEKQALAGAAPEGVNAAMGRPRKLRRRPAVSAQGNTPSQTG
jgi:hypothetical protein